MPFNAIGANCRAVTRWQCHSWYRPQLTLPTGCAHHENLLLPACARIFVIKSIDGFVHLLCSKIGKHPRRAEQRLTISTSCMALTHPTPLFHRGSRVLITKDDLSRLGASSSEMPSCRARLNLTSTAVVFFFFGRVGHSPKCHWDCAATLLSAPTPSKVPHKESDRGSEGA